MIWANASKAKLLLIAVLVGVKFLVNIGAHLKQVFHFLLLILLGLKGDNRGTYIDWLLVDVVQKILPHHFADELLVLG